MATHPFDELLSVLIDSALRESDFAKADILVHLLRILRVEWAPSATHFEQQDAQGPEIDKLGVTMLVQEHLRSQVFSCATECCRQLVRAEIGFRQSKVAKGDVSCGI